METKALLFFARGFLNSCACETGIHMLGNGFDMHVSKSSTFNLDKYDVLCYVDVSLSHPDLGV